MQNQAFTTLEYDQLRALIRRDASTPMGQSRVDALGPIEDLEQLLAALTALDECCHLRQQGVGWSFGELSDPRESIARLRVEGASLEPTAILELARLCDQAMTARASLLANREACPILSAFVTDIPRELNSLVARIANKILPGGDLDDRASPELARIRHEITRLRSSIMRSLENLMRRFEAAIQDELVTVRNDRFVIPVKASNRARIPGVAHGFSSSGATAFVEPMEAIDANNHLQNLRETEQREIARILLELTQELRSRLPGIEMAAQAIGELDFINAKALFCQKFSCVIPQIDSPALMPASSRAGTLEFIEARHPLLEENLHSSGSAVVPVSFSLDEKHDAMVISGANAGGKTVVLKTAGLLSLMALSGLPVPAREARVPFYLSVLADIGDHQSLAANLSTFTSHIANISRMIELCKAPALVLLDEVGTGTDPEEGSALGVAIVDHFRKVCCAHVMATTHYSGLKVYAANEERVLNASVEFDDKTLRPTYRLIVGVAGSSSGLEIARRFGVSGEIVSAASELVSDSSRQAGEYLNRIKREAEEAAALRRALDIERAAVAEKFALLDKEADKRERERQTAFQRELEQTVAELERRSRELVASIQDRSERLKVEREAQRRVAELKREAQHAAGASRKRESSSAAAGSSQARGVQVLRAGRRPQEDRVPQQDKGTEPDREPYIVAEKREVVVGDRVRLRAFGSIGIVDSLKGDEAEVRVKSLRFREKLENLELVEAVVSVKSEGSRFAKLRTARGTEVHLKNPDQNGRAELNVIGQTADEAIAAVDKFLDEAFMNSLSQVRVVHGHGTGALRRAIGDLLKGHPHVERYAPAAPDQGGAGAMVVDLRD